jgi:hypothetical protein
MADPPKIDPTGAVAALLNNIGGLNSTGVATVSSLIGLIVVFASGGAAAVPVAAILAYLSSFISSNNSTTNEVQFLEDIANEIQKAFSQLELDDGAAERLQIVSDINQIIYGTGSGGSWTAMTSMARDLEQNPDPAKLDPASVDAWNGHVNSAIMNLSQGDDPKWWVTFDFQPYWTDAGRFFNLMGLPGSYANGSPVDVGYGLQAPPHSSTDKQDTLCYTFSLPALLVVISNWIAVETVLTPGFMSDLAERPALEQAVNFLQKLHDTVQAAITPLSPPYWEYSNLANIVANQKVSVVPGIRSIYTDNDGGYGAIIEYGAVEKYSGYSDMNVNYIVSIDAPGANISSGSGPYNKLQLRVKQKAKNIYNHVLLDAWNVINQLYTLLGTANNPHPNFGDWSFRKEIIPNSSTSASANGTWSLRSVATSIINFVPYDTAGLPPGYVVERGVVPPVSFRGLLNPAIATQGPPPGSVIGQLNRN